MAFDEELFFARRLGLGLKHGETISGDVRNWVVEQFKSIPKLDFYGPDDGMLLRLSPCRGRSGHRLWQIV